LWKGIRGGSGGGGLLGVDAVGVGVLFGVVVF